MTRRVCTERKAKPVEGGWHNPNVDTNIYYRDRVITSRKALLIRV